MASSSTGGGLGVPWPHPWSQVPLHVAWASPSTGGWGRCTWSGAAGLREAGSTSYQARQGLLLELAEQPCQPCVLLAKSSSPASYWSNLLSLVLLVRAAAGFAETKGLGQWTETLGGAGKITRDRVRWKMVSVSSFGKLSAIVATVPTPSIRLFSPHAPWPSNHLPLGVLCAAWTQNIQNWTQHLGP